MYQNISYMKKYDKFYLTIYCRIWEYAINYMRLKECRCESLLFQ